MLSVQSLVLAATTVAVVTTAPAGVARAEVDTPPGQALAAGASAGVPEGALSGGLPAQTVDPTSTQIPGAAWMVSAAPIDDNDKAPADAPADVQSSSVAWLGGALVLGLLTAGVIVSLRKRR